MLLGYHYSRYASNPFSYADDKHSNADQSSQSRASSHLESVQSSASACISRISSSASDCFTRISWFTSSSPSTPAPATQPIPQVKTGPSTLGREHNTSDTETRPGKTTFSFVLVGVTVLGALTYAYRTRRGMKRIIAIRSLAKRDARAWRRVALEFAKISAAPSAHSSRDSELARYILNGVRSKGDSFIFDSDLHHKLNEEKVSSSITEKEAESSSPPKDTFTPGSSILSATHIRSKLSDGFSGSVSTSSGMSNAEKRWRRAGGMDVSYSAPSAASQEDWIGNLNAALRHRQQKARSCLASKVDAGAPAGHYEPTSEDQVFDHQPDSLLYSSDWTRSLKDETRNSKAAAPAGDYEPFAIDLSADKDDYLLPVSDLEIASPSHSSSGNKPATRSKSKPLVDAVPMAESDPDSVPIHFTRSVYPHTMSDPAQDLEDIFMAAWDDGYGRPKTFAKPWFPPEEEALSSKRDITSRDGERAKDPAETSKMASNTVLIKDKLPVWTSKATPAPTAGAPELPSTSAPVSASLPKEYTSEPYNPAYELPEELELGEPVPLGLDATPSISHLHEENQRLVEANERMAKRVDELEHRLGMMNVWAESIHRRLGLEGEYAFSKDRVGGSQTK